MGSQLGADQKYYISRCEEKRSIQLTITVVGDDEKHNEERRNLIDDVAQLLDDIMKVFMPAKKERPSLLIPCPFCPVLHILLDDICSGKNIFCPNVDDKCLPCGYYSDLLKAALAVATVITGKVASYCITLLYIAIYTWDKIGHVYVYMSIIYHFDTLD